VLTDAGGTFAKPGDVRPGTDIETWSRHGGYVRLQSDRDSFARWLEERFGLLVGGTNEMSVRVVRTSTRQVHVVPGASPDLIHHALALENGEMEAIGGNEEFVGDAGHSCPVHQQDRAAFGVELPPALEDGALNGGYVSVSLPMRWVVEMNENTREFETHAPTSALASTPRTSYE
jgi:hypothetical protein